MNTKSWRIPPGPAEKYDTSEDLLGWMKNHFRQFGDIYKASVYGTNVYVVNDPDYADHVLHEARLKYVKSNEYEPVRASAGINLLTDEGDSWAAHRGVLNPTFAVTNRSPCWAA